MQRHDRAALLAASLEPCFPSTPSVRQPWPFQSDELNPDKQPSKQNVYTCGPSRAVLLLRRCALSLPIANHDLRLPRTASSKRNEFHFRLVFPSADAQEPYILTRSLPSSLSHSSSLSIPRCSTAPPPPLLRLPSPAFRIAPEASPHPRNSTHLFVLSRPPSLAFSIPISSLIHKQLGPSDPTHLGTVKERFIVSSPPPLALPSKGGHSRQLKSSASLLISAYSTHLHALQPQPLESLQRNISISHWQPHSVSISEREAHASGSSGWREEKVDNVAGHGNEKGVGSGYIDRH